MGSVQKKSVAVKPVVVKPVVVKPVAVKPHVVKPVVRTDVEVDKVSEALSGRLLMMANRYRTEGDIHQALEIYWTLVDEYPDTSQAKIATKKLMEIAEEYDREGARRMARSMFERLLAETV